jgi:type I restriction enzyme S subunit
MTAAEKRHTPELRFPEFEGEWERQYIGHFIEDYKVKSTVQDQFEVFTSARSGLVRQKDYYDNERITGRENIGFNVIPPNFVTYRSRSDDRRFYFNENKLDGTGIISVYYPVFKIVGGSNKFFIELFSRKVHEIGKYSVGTSQTVLSMNELKKIKFPIPCTAEQQKIAAFLGAVDNKLTALRRKRELLQEFKRGMMQKIFSRELRFKREDGSDFPDWEEKRLGEVASFSKGKGISKSDIVEGGRIPCIRYGELYTRYNELIDDIVSFTNEDPANLLLSKKNDVIIPASGESAIDIATAACVMKDGVALGGDLNIIRGGFNGVFLSYYLNNGKRNEVARLAQGISIVHLYGSQLVQLKINLPCSDEQQKIDDFLSAIDTKIESVAKQIGQIETFKKGLLQKMFV